MTAPTIAQCLTEIEGITVHRGARPEAGSDLPLASIVIATLNSANDLPATLDSISAQTWPNLEVVVADGGSRDGTLDLIRVRGDMISKWISAPDRGISDGFSRAVALSTGTVVQIICAGDRLSPDQIERSTTLLRENPGAGFAYSDVEMIDAKGRPTRMARGVAAFHLGYFDTMAVAPHPALCARRATYEAVGLFDSDMRHVMDFDWLARCRRIEIIGVYSNSVGAQMAEGGNNNRHAIERDLENFKVTRRYSTMPVPLATLRLGLRLGMDVVRLGLEAMGAERASFVFRRWVDISLGRI
jgi:glycosyltransferase involved in cell wall biosynthesis